MTDIKDVDISKVTDPSVYWEPERQEAFYKKFDGIKYVITSANELVQRKAFFGTKTGLEKAVDFIDRLLDFMAYTNLKSIKIRKGHYFLNNDEGNAEFAELKAAGKL